MEFTVKYRGADGRVDYKVVNANSRSEVFPVLKDMGIVAISITEGTQKPKRTSIGVSRRVPIISVIVSVTVAVVVFLLLPEKSNQNEKPKSVTQKTEKIIKSTTVPITPKTNAAPVKVLSKREQQLKEIRDKYGDNIPDNYKAIVYFLENPPKKRFKAKGTHSYLRHPSERQIAGVALVEPGTYFVIKPEFDASFDRDFVNALLDKNEPNEDDTEEVRMVKQEIAQIKKDISELCRKEGRKPSEILNDHAAAMYELGRYQRDLEGELDKIYADPELTDKDVEDFCEAANQMLQSKGLKTLPIPNLTRRSLRIQHFQRMAEKRAARKAAKENK